MKSPRSLPVFASLAAALTACAAPAARSPAQVFAPDTVAYVFADADRQAKIAAAFPTIDALVEAKVRDDKLAGAVLGVVVDGALVHVASAGVVDLETKARPDADTVYRIGSITKSFTALAVLALRDDGALSLGDPMARLLPETESLVYPTRDSTPITLRHLITHTSGLPRQGKADGPGVFRSIGEAEVFKDLAGLSLERPPGAAYSYSNLGFGLLGIAAGRAAKSSLHAFVNQRILAPLGMTSTYWDRASVPKGRLATPYKRDPKGHLVVTPTPDVGALEGAGQIYSTIRDMARYAALHLSAYPARNEPDTGPILRSSIREAHQSGVRSVPLHVEMKSGRGVTGIAGTYAYGWGIDETCDFDSVVRHGGAVEGFSADLALLPENGVAVVVLTNASGNGASLDHLTTKALLAIRDKGGLSRRVARLKHVPPAFDPALRKLIALINVWDDQGYRQLSGRPRSAMNDEREEIAGYRNTHGSCKGWTPRSLDSPRHAVFDLACERASLQMEIELGPDGNILGFVGTSRDVEASPALARAADRIAGLIGRWDEEVARKHLAPKAQRPETEDRFARIRADRGACKVKSFYRWGNEPRFTLACERGADITLEVGLDEKDEEVIARYALINEGAGACRAW